MQFGTEWFSAEVGPVLPGSPIVVSLRGELDVASAHLVPTIFAGARAVPGATIVVDAAELRFLDLAGARALLAEATEARAAGGDLLLCNAGSAVRLLLAASGLAALLPVVGDRAAPQASTP